VDDGSSDATPSVCERFAEELPLTSFRIAKSGTAAAKNLGLFASQAPLVLFFDDDDLADPRLLAEHVEAHRAQPEENVAVLGYTTWASELEITPVMDFVTRIGQYLFAYENIEDGQMLDFSYFWVGRSSCKRSFLAKHGTFDQDFDAIEDVELGYRLSKHGLAIVHARSAKSFMVRPITFDEFARRCVKHGRGLWRFNRRHPDPVVERHCRVAEALEASRSRAPHLEAKMDRVRELERRYSEQGELEESALTELRELYRWTFDALRARGIAEAEAEARGSEPAQAQASKPSGDQRLAISPPQAPATTICPDPIFVIGSPRSGTTALGHALAEHSDLWISGESDFLLFLFADRYAERAFDRALAVPGPRWLRLEQVSRDEFLAYLGMGINALITSRSGGRRWIDHTPHYTGIAETLAGLFPGARFIHILRDGRYVVHSMLNFADSIPDPVVGRFLKETVAWATDMQSACETWRDEVEAGMAFCESHVDHATVVRYEDVVISPRAAFSSIHRFLGIADEEGPARYLASTRINSSFNGRPRLSADELWERWDEEQRRTFAEVAGPTMRRYGFSMSDHVVAGNRPNGAGG
jgi:Sulfotransferase family/Glycosyl transferase family 2